MPAFLGAAALALGASFVAEFGDKSQLLVLGFATRHAALPVIVGLAVAAAVVQGISVAIGVAAGSVLPAEAVAVVAGIVFLVVAAWTLRDAGEPGEDSHGGDADAVASGSPHRSLVVLAAVVAGTFFLGELGDKTMLTTLALAARQDPLATWLGATAGMVGANLVAVVVGSQLGRHLSPVAVRRGSAALLAAFGILLVGGALLPT